MELKELCENVLYIFEVNDIKQLKEKLYKSVIEHDVDKLNAFCELVNNDLSIDWLQKIFQYYEADRKEKMQDYTPKSLAKMVAKLSKHNEIIDMCAGSGALSIQKWNLDKDIYLKLYEFDQKVIPYLLFNLSIRNINAHVYHMDVLTQDVFNEYILKKDMNFSVVEVKK